MNDPSEVRYGVSLFIDEFNNKVKEELPTYSDLRLNFRKLEREIEKVATHLSFSFSTSKDDLSQWRSYADDGAGYCLVFDRADVEKNLASGQSNLSKEIISSFMVQYDDKEELARIHRKYLKLGNPLFNEVKSWDSIKTDAQKEFLNKMHQYFALAAISNSLLYKHKAYSQEKEYRLLQIHNYSKPLGSFKTRRKPSEIVKYAEFNWKDRVTLKEVMVGPGKNQQNRVKFVKDLLVLQKFTGVKVIPSDIPYRGKE